MLNSDRTDELLASLSGLLLSSLELQNLKAVHLYITIWGDEIYQFHIVDVDSESILKSQNSILFIRAFIFGQPREQLLGEVITT